MNTESTEPMNSELIIPEKLSARIEPFDSYWQAPKDVEKGYTSFFHYYKANFLPYVGSNRQADILIVSAGPGYLVNLLKQQGYSNVLGIDSDPRKVEQAKARGLNCRTAEAFPFLSDKRAAYDVIVCEQELNHLTLEEMLTFLKLCQRAMRPGGTLLVYGLNGANPLVGSENLAHNIDHFNTFTEYSLRQVLEINGFERIRLLPLKLYVFWKNPANYVGLIATGLFHLFFRACYILYGKDAKILTKKIAAVCHKPA
ncbi:MAG: class I SAM-dependent methyltransferase [Phycisphaeraceae bacterium]|nr:class I SAM-dependent methyltransferase [Phycisphaeraceae bacterium]